MWSATKPRWLGLCTARCCIANVAEAPACYNSNLLGMMLRFSKGSHSKTSGRSRSRRRALPTMVFRRSRKAHRLNSGLSLDEKSQFLRGSKVKTHSRLANVLVAEDILRAKGIVIAGILLIEGANGAGGRRGVAARPVVLPAASWAPEEVGERVENLDVEGAGLYRISGNRTLPRKGDCSFGTRVSFQPAAGIRCTEASASAHNPRTKPASAT
jgi:hypothetical protein